ncbi:MAG: hypothetical protein ACLP7Q_10830 [Isosphaeraceae bacterium]
MTLMDRLLKETARLYADDEQKIADIATDIRQEFGRAGRPFKIAEFLDGSTRWEVPGYFDRGQPEKIDHYCEMYRTFRTGKNGQGHKAAMYTLRVFVAAAERNAGQFVVDRKNSLEGVSEDEMLRRLEKSTPAQAIAMLESHSQVPTDDPWVIRYDDLLGKAAAIYQLQEADIAIEVYGLFKEIWAADEKDRVGQLPFIDEILQGAITAGPSVLQMGRPSLRAYVDRYRRLKLKTKLPHDAIIDRMLSDS